MSEAETTTGSTTSRPSCASSASLGWETICPISGQVSDHGAEHLEVQELTRRCGWLAGRCHHSAWLLQQPAASLGTMDFVTDVEGMIAESAAKSNSFWNSAACFAEGGCHRTLMDHNTSRRRPLVEDELAVMFPAICSS